MKSRLDYDSAPSRNLRILVVDDNEMIHADFRQLLCDRYESSKLEELEAMLFPDSRARTRRRLPFTVDCAHSGEQALGMIEESVRAGQPYAMAFVDMLMPPGWDGLETVGHLWRVDARIEIVVCTAYAGQDMSNFIDALGESDQLLFLAKPFHGREVLQLAYALTRKWTLRREAERNSSHLEALVEQRTLTLQDTAARLASALSERKALTRSIQETLNPTPGPVHAGGLVLAGWCETCDECGGDWWMYQALADGRLLVAIGDVTGHGIPAAMVAAATRGAISAMNEHCPSMHPRQVLTTLDSVVRSLGRGQLWMTCFVACFDAEHDEVAYANAGHVQPYVIRGDGAIESLLGIGSPLGSPDPFFFEKRLPLHRDEVFVFYSDGITERRNAAGKEFGDKRLRSLLRSSASIASGSTADNLTRVQALCDQILEGVLGHGGDCPSADDLTLIVCHYS